MNFVVIYKNIVGYIFAFISLIKYLLKRLVLLVLIISIINIDIAATATGQKQAGACGCPDFYIYHTTGEGRRKGEEEHESEAKGCRAAGACHGSNGTAVMGTGRRNALEQWGTQYGSSGDRVDRQ